MSHFGRRLTYLALGVAPPLLWILNWLWIGDAYFAGSLLMLAGLMVATISPRPGSNLARMTVAALVAAGTTICWQSFATEQILDGFINSVKRQGSSDLAYAAMTSWFLFGPALCTVHFLWARRCTPNNSSKPTPLRGAA